MVTKINYLIQNLRNSMITIGADGKLPENERRSIISINRLSFLFTLIATLNIALIWLMVGAERISFLLITQPILLSTPIIFNKFGYINTSRILLSWIPTLITTIYSVYTKLHGQDLETSGYVGFRIVLIACFVVPFLIFSLKQRILLALALTFPLIALFGFDQIHAFFGIGYSQVGLTDVTYHLTNTRVLIAVLSLGGGAILLRQKFEESEETNTHLLDALNDAYQEVQTQMEEIASQNKKINTENEDIQIKNLTLQYQYKNTLEKNVTLSLGKKNIKQAHEKSEEQKQILATENEALELELVERNEKLEEMNRDLIKTYNNLSQYSYMISHNLRGPVASIIGLLSIVPKDNLDPTLMSICEKTHTSIQQLDSVIREIHMLLDSEKSPISFKQKVYWEDVVNKNLKVYEQEIEQYGIQITCDFLKAPFIVSINHIIESIVYNLISNAIKFRAPNRTLDIQIQTRFENQQVVFQITDNGLGINLELQKDYLFKMYKRLHTHVEGKGLGLYMTKMQAELLHGSIDVDSDLNHHTTFTLRLPNSDAGKQIIIEDDTCLVSHNILIGSIEIGFKQNLTSEGFRANYLKILEYFKKLKTTSVLENMQNSMGPTAEDQEWFNKNIIPDAAKSGLKKMAILTSALENGSNLEKFIFINDMTCNKLGIEQRIYTNIDEANEWLSNPS